MITRPSLLRTPAAAAGVDGFIRKYWPFLKALKVPTIIASTP